MCGIARVYQKQVSAAILSRRDRRRVLLSLLSMLRCLSMSFTKETYIFYIILSRERSATLTRGELLSRRFSFALFRSLTAQSL